MTIIIATIRTARLGVAAVFLEAPRALEGRRGRGRGAAVVSPARPPPPGAMSGAEHRAGGLRVGTRWLWTFSPHLRRVTAARCWLRGPSFSSQQKGNRCAVMSTADYSRNIARTKNKKKGKKEAPPQPLRAISSPSSLPVGRADGRTVFRRWGRGVGKIKGLSGQPSTTPSTAAPRLCSPNAAEVRRPRLGGIRLLGAGC